MAAILITSKYNSFCKTCKGTISVGGEVFWTPGEKGVAHRKCPMPDSQKITTKKLFETGDTTPIKGFESLFDHQAEAVNIVRKYTNRLYLGWEAGTGKSLGSLAAAHEDQAFPLLIVSPPVNKINWQREVEHWLGREAEILSSREPWEITKEIAIINYDVIHEWQDQIIKWGPKGLIADESQYIKNPGAKRTLAVGNIADHIDDDGMIFMLSGTPTPTSVYDLVAPLTILGVMDEFGDPRNYIKRYCPPVRTTYGVSHKNARHLDELHDNLKNVCFIRKTKEECLDLPEKLTLSIPVDVHVDNSIYNELLSNMTSGTLRAARAAVRDLDVMDRKAHLAKARRLAGESKIDAIVELASEIDSPLVIMVHHRSVQSEVNKRLKKRGSLLLSGGMTANARQKAIDAFQNGDCDVLVCSISAAGLGINLHRASQMIIGELPMSHAELEQAESRCYRSGQRNALTIRRVIGVGTSDEIMVNMINKKEATSAKVEDGLEADTLPAEDIIAQRLVELYRERYGA